MEQEHSDGQVCIAPEALHLEGERERYRSKEREDKRGEVAVIGMEREADRALRRGVLSSGDQPTTNPHVTSE